MFSKKKYLFFLLLSLTLILSSCMSSESKVIDDNEYLENLSALVNNPAEDVPGKDFKTIPRYPGSLRIAYKKSEAKKKILYGTAYEAQGSLKEVSSFYENEMEKNGWLLEVKEDLLLTMIFVRKETASGLPIAQLMFRTSENGNSTIINLLIQDEKR